MLIGAVATGEVHLETCIKDLRERFARVELTVSPPLVAFRESVADSAEAPDTVHRPPKARLDAARTSPSPSLRNWLSAEVLQR
jgi:translation elongation factor EF-G